MTEENKQATFIKTVQSQNRFAIPYEVAKVLDIKKGCIVKVIIEVLQNPGEIAIGEDGIILEVPEE